MDAQRIGEEITARMRQLGLDQQELAMRAGVSPSTVRKLQNATAEKYQPSTLRKISSALGWEEQSLAQMFAGALTHPPNERIVVVQVPEGPGPLRVRALEDSPWTEEHAVKLEDLMERMRLAPQDRELVRRLIATMQPMPSDERMLRAAYDAEVGENDAAVDERLEEIANQRGRERRRRK